MNYATKKNRNERNKNEFIEASVLTFSNILHRRSRYAHKEVHNSVFVMFISFISSSVSVELTFTYKLKTSIDSGRLLPMAKTFFFKCL